jgi:hypothetical protein
MFRDRRRQKKKEGKKKGKKLDPEYAERVPNKQHISKPRHEKEALLSGWSSSCRWSPRSVCDSLAVMSPPAASFLGASAGQWNHGTGDPKSRFVSRLSTSGYGEGANGERKSGE